MVEVVAASREAVAATRERVVATKEGVTEGMARAGVAREEVARAQCEPSCKGLCLQIASKAQPKWKPIRRG